ncbi:uncharacterized protein LOC135837735 [Planococcus citri]|uniref:uncharacterized protein LOC135837735 n=1 Tax=Planococcus citri TaxID=170843 RepID=UPI0031F9A941
MVMIEKCCCGCPLREGSLAIVILDFISTCFYIIHLYAIANTYDPEGNKYKSPGILITFILLFHPLAGIIGILKDLPRGILIYVVCSLVRLLTIGFDILLLFLFSKTMFVDIPKDYQIEIVAILGAWATHVYYTAVVYSYYQELTERNKSSASATNV